VTEGGRAATELRQSNNNVRQNQKPTRGIEVRCPDRIRHNRVKDEGENDAIAQPETVIHVDEAKLLARKTASGGNPCVGVPSPAAGKRGPCLGIGALSTMMPDPSERRGARSEHGGVPPPWTPHLRQAHVNSCQVPHEQRNALALTPNSQPTNPNIKVPTFHRFFRRGERERISHLCSIESASPPGVL
jgi:hypothetical protein